MQSYEKWPNDCSVFASRIEEIVQGIHSKDLNAVLDYTYMIRTLVCADDGQGQLRVTIKQAIPRLVELLTIDHRPDIQFEVSWVMSNITAVPEVQTSEDFTNAGVWPIFVKLLKSDTADYYVAWNVVRTMANIVHESRHLRAVTDLDIVSSLACTLNRSLCEGFMGTMAECVRILLKDQLLPSSNAEIMACTPLVIRLLLCEFNEVVLTICSHLTKIKEHRTCQYWLQHMLNLRVPLRLLTIIDTSTNLDNQNVAFDCFWKFCKTHAGIVVIELGAFAAIQRLLKDRTAGNGRVAHVRLLELVNLLLHWNGNVQAVIDAGLVPILVQGLTSTSRSIQIEVRQAVETIAFYGDTDQIRVLLDQGALPPLVDSLINYRRIPQVATALRTLRLILVRGKKSEWRSALSNILKELEFAKHLERILEDDDELISSAAIVRQLYSEYVQFSNE